MPFRCSGRIDHASVDSVDQLAFGSDHLQQSLEFGMHELGAYKLKRIVDLPVKFGIGYHFTYARGSVDEYHGDTVAYGGLRGQILRLKDARSGDEPHYFLEKLQRLLGIRAVAGGLRIFGHGYGREAFGEHVAAFTQRASVGCNLEIHTSVGRIYAMVSMKSMQFLAMARYSGRRSILL